MFDPALLSQLEEDRDEFLGDSQGATSNSNKQVQGEEDSGIPLTPRQAEVSNQIVKALQGGNSNTSSGNSIIDVTGGETKADDTNVCFLQMATGEGKSHIALKTAASLIDNRRDCMLNSSKSLGANRREYLLASISRRKSTIVVGARTHASCQQWFKVAGCVDPPALVCGGRSKLCLHEPVRGVSNPEEQRTQCHKARGDGTCPYAAKDPDTVHTHRKMLGVEDTISVARAHKVCPYYLQRHWLQDGRFGGGIVIGPHGMLDTMTRFLGDGGVLVVDECHHLGKKSDWYVFLFVCLAGNLRRKTEPSHSPG